MNAGIPNIATVTSEVYPPPDRSEATHWKQPPFGGEPVTFHQTRTAYVRGLANGRRTWAPIGQVCVSCDWTDLKRDRLTEAVPDKLHTCPDADDVRIVQRGATTYRMRTGRIGEGR